jgi:hypothetical protein
MYGSSNKELKGIVREEIFILLSPFCAFTKNGRFWPNILSLGSSFYLLLMIYLTTVSVASGYIASNTEVDSEK